MGKCRFWALFEKALTKTSCFFGERSHSKFVYIGTETAFRKILGLDEENGCQKNYQSGDFLVGERVESLRVSVFPPPQPTPEQIQITKKATDNFCSGGFVF